MVKRLVMITLTFILCVLIVAAIWNRQARSPSPPPVYTDTASNIFIPAKVVGEELGVYDGTEFTPKFWNGVNLGATLPGYSPGELAPTEEDYTRWFQQMKEMNVDVLRVYTLLPPHFYETLAVFNAGRRDPLYLLQGIWSPEEELIGDDGQGRDAYTPSIVEEFHQEITDVVKAVHGDLERAPQPGHASGHYTVDVATYVLGWIVGTEWYPLAVQLTDKQHAGEAPYQGQYITASPEATPFESWLAELLDHAAKVDMSYGWQHPIAFTNWVTTDPLGHPNEPLVHEDLVSVDPMHVIAKADWQAGYFSAYHAYPYYPDSIRLTDTADPYAAYLNKLKAHHSGIPILIAEFGVPSSRGLAHYGPLGYNQGMHSERAQGVINVQMLETIRSERYSGAVLFAWHDEWFKFTWNTTHLELPERRAMWRNRLTNEEHFGLIAVESGETADDVIYVDGSPDEWEDHAPVVSTPEEEESDLRLSLSHDAANLYLKLEKQEGDWDLERDQLLLSFDTTEGGAMQWDEHELTLPQPADFLLRIADGEAELLVNAAYDPHVWKFGQELGLEPVTDSTTGSFNPWRLLVSFALTVPDTGKEIPLEEIMVGRLHYGNANPEAEEYNSLADWYADGSVLELRIPWMLLGFMDPSQHQVWDYPVELGSFEPIPTEGISVSAFLTAAPAEDEEVSGSAVPDGEPTTLFYSWEPWDLPVYHERPKASYEMVKEAFSTEE